MMNSLDSTAKTLVVLGTGGTIAGTASSADDHTGYTAAQLSVAQLLSSVPGLEQALAGARLESEQVAQLDSKDMDFSTLARLAQRCVHHLQRTQVAGIVITHGTDTLEETAYFLHLVLHSALPELMAHKPVVLTCAMRPATSSQADGPRNLRDAVRLAGDAQASGVMAVCAGDVHQALHMQKASTYALNAFSSGMDAHGAPRYIAQVNATGVTWNNPSHAPELASKHAIFKPNTASDHIECARNAHYLIANSQPTNIHWPRIEVILNHAQQGGQIVRALLAASTHSDPLRGIVVAATGNGTVSQDLQAALDEAGSQCVKIEICTRCAWDDLPDAEPAARQALKARIRLMLQLLSTP
jgi:L-asparaginase